MAGETEKKVMKLVEDRAILQKHLEQHNTSIDLYQRNVTFHQKEVKEIKSRIEVIKVELNWLYKE